MATIKTDLICNLNQPVNVTYLHGNLFSQDNAGNTINVFVMDNGEPATIGGTVSANVIRSDDQTVAVSGAIEGNKAYVILPQACYAVPGVVHIIIKLTQSTTVTTIAAVVANVYMSTTDAVIDPGTVIPSIQALMALIEEAVDSIPTDYTGLLHTIAADYSSSKTYKVGDYAWESGVLKRCIVPITAAETYTAAHWTNAVIGDDLTNLKSAITDITGNTPIPITAQNAYIKWENYKMDYENPTPSTNFDYYLVPCTAGDVFTVNATGGNASRAWGFIDSSKTALLYANASETVENLVLIAPTNAVYLIINDRKTGALSYYGNVIQNTVSGIEDDMNVLNAYNAIDYKPLLQKTNAGMTYTPSGDSINVNGTATSATYYILWEDEENLPDGINPGDDCEISWALRNDNIFFRMYYYDSNGLVTTAVISTNADAVVKVPDDAVGLSLRIWIANGTSISNVPVSVSFAHYSNKTLGRMCSTLGGMLQDGKKIAMFGDSVMWGRDGNGSASTRVENTIPVTVAKRTGAIADNYGVGGMGYMRLSDASFDTGHRAYDKISTTDITGYDVIVLAFGVNDGFFNPGAWDSTDENTCLGQFNKIINYIYTQNSTCQVVVFAPINGTNVGEYPDYWYGDVTDPDAGSQHQGRWSRKLLSDALKEACEYYWIPYFEVYDCPINAKTAAVSLPDGVHPSADAYLKLGDWYAAKLKSII